MSDGNYSSFTSISNNTPPQIGLDKLFAWNIQFVATDKFDSVAYDLALAKGRPIMFFDSQKLSVSINSFPSHNDSFECNNLYVSDATYLTNENMVFQSGSWTPTLNSRNGANPSYEVQHVDAKYK